MAMAISVPLYAVDDLDGFPRDGNRYELLDGVLLVTPAPSMSHRLVASRLQVGSRSSWRKVPEHWLAGEFETVHEVLHWRVPGTDSLVSIGLEGVFSGL